MTRAFFMAVAITLMILGGECMFLNRAVMAKQILPPAATEYGHWEDPLAVPLESKLVHKTITPPEWAPWSLLSSGAVMMLYAMTMRRGGSGD